MHRKLIARDGNEEGQMMRTIFDKVMWVGRATVFVVGSTVSHGIEGGQTGRWRLSPPRPVSLPPATPEVASRTGLPAE
jgi:hypothetical protein